MFKYLLVYKCCESAIFVHDSVAQLAFEFIYLYAYDSVAQLAFEFIYLYAYARRHLVVCMGLRKLIELSALIFTDNWYFHWKLYNLIAVTF